VSDRPTSGQSRSPAAPGLTLRREGDQLWATLDEPDRANALSPALVAALTALYSRPLLDEGVRAVVLIGAGRHFSAGADLAHLRSLRQEALTVALVHGACIAGGCGLATAHDFVVAADDARFMYSEVKIGFVAALVATFLPLRVRGSDLRELLLFPRLLEAREALGLGLVNRVVPRADLEQAGLALVKDVLAGASSQSIARTKRLLLDLLGRPLDEALDLAAEQNAQARLSADCQRGIAHFLATKQAPSW
jgi:methylglutaconyl-CoA hydratase